MSQSTQKFDIDNQQLSLAGSDLSISKGNTVTLPLEIPIGGTSGQLLAKQSDTNYDVTWVNEAPASSYTSVIKHKVKAGESLTKGQAVYVSSASGTNMVVTKASNTSEATSSKTMGLIAQTLANNGQGDIIAEGLLSGLNTNTATIGDPVWLGTNGNLIYGLINKPYAPAHLVFIGIVTRVSATVGEIFVKVQNGFELNEIHDVDLKTTTPINGDILGYNGTLWVNKSITALGGQTQLNGTGFVKATGTTISYDNSTYLLTSTASSTYLPINNPTSTGTLTAPTIANSLGANFATTSGNVGIGTTAPSAKLEIYGAGAIAQKITSSDNVAQIITSGTLGQIYNVTGDFYLTNVSSTAQIRLQTNGTDRLNIFSNGRVGINTTTDAGYLLDVNGSARLNGNVSIGTTANTRTLTVYTATNDVNLESINSRTTGNNYAIAATANGIGADLNMGGFFQSYGATNNYGLRIYNVVASANNYAIYSDSPAQSYFQGNVGIGTSPTYKTHIYGAGEAISGGITNAGAKGASLYIQDSGAAAYNGGAVVFGASQGVGSAIKYEITDGTANSKGDLSFQVRPNTSDTFLTTALQIKSTGNVGIGTTSATNLLHLKSTNPVIRLETATNNGYIDYSTTRLNISSGGVYTTFTAGDAERMRIFSNGRVGIGTTTDAGYLLDVNGSARVASNLIIENAGTSSLKLANTGNTDWNISNSSFALKFDQDGIEKMRISSVSGNVGIGTTTPTSKLQVVGLLEYATNALAIAGGLTVGAFYHTTGVVKVVI